MPFYSYLCETNAKVTEVYHPIHVRLKNWGEVCKCADIEPGNTPVSAPVIRLIGGMPIVWKLKGLDKDAPSNKLQL